jgi:hypothetical protein
MRCLLASAILVAGMILPPSLGAQFRMAPRNIPSSSIRFSHPTPGLVRTGVAKPAPPVVHRGGYGAAPYGGRSFGGFGGFGQTRCLADPYHMGSILCRPYREHEGLYYSQPWFMPSLWYMPTEYQSAEQTSAPLPEQDNAVVSQLQKLTDEVEQLQEERASREESRPPAFAPGASVEAKPAAILVYRDGHRSEVQNYAVLGQTLWVFADQATRRIPLTDLDLDATKKLNDERGVDFVSPNLR